MIAAFLIAQVAAFALGYFVRPTIEDALEERRFRLHYATCDHCWKVKASDGPAWLYCAEGRTRGAKATPARWCDLRDVMRESDGVPSPREVRDGN